MYHRRHHRRHHRRSPSRWLASLTRRGIFGRWLFTHPAFGDAYRRLGAGGGESEGQPRFSVPLVKFREPERGTRRTNRAFPRGLIAPWETYVRLFAREIIACRVRWWPAILMARHDARLRPAE